MFAFSHNQPQIIIFIEGLIVASLEGFIACGLCVVPEEGHEFVIFGIACDRMRSLLRFRLKFSNHFSRETQNLKTEENLFERMIASLIAFAAKWKHL